MLFTTDMKVSTLLQRHSKEFLNAACASPLLYPLTHSGEVLSDTFSLFATIHPDGTVAELLDFMAKSCTSPTARTESFQQLERDVATRNQNLKAQALFGFKADTLVLDNAPSIDIPAGGLITVEEATRMAQCAADMAGIPATDTTARISATAPEPPAEPVHAEFPKPNDINRPKPKPTSPFASFKKKP